MSPHPSGSATRMQIEAAQVVRDQRFDNAERTERLAPRVVVTCARGSSDAATIGAKYLIETRLAVPSGSADPSVSSLYGAHPNLCDAVCVAASHSGASPDLLASVRKAREAGARVVALVKARLPVFVFSQNGQARASTEMLTQHLVARSANVMIAGSRCSKVLQLPAVSAHPVTEPLRLIQTFQRLANNPALARGLDPDHPPHLLKITEAV